MNEEIINRVIRGMGQSLEPCQHVLNRMYDWHMNSLFPWGKSQNADELKELGDLLAVQLQLAAKRTSMYLEILGLTETRIDFLARWEELGPDYSKTEPWYNEEDEGFESKPLDFLNEFYQSLRLLIELDSSVSVDPEKEPLLNQLEYILLSTAQVMRNFGKDPIREYDIQEVMNAHLKTVFSDYTTNVIISKPIAGFKPDGGIISLRSAIEFKFCDNEKDIKEALRGVTEDLSGYAGSLDWKRFYCVIYQTKAFTNERQFQHSLKLSGNADMWSFIVVTGGKS